MRHRCSFGRPNPSEEVTRQAVHELERKIILSVLEANRMEP